MKKTIVAVTLCLLIGSILYAQGTIKGEVTDKAGKPIAYLQLLLKKNNRAVNGAYTDELGVYQICEIEEGTYDISVGGTVSCPKQHVEKDISISGSEVKFINFTIICEPAEIDDLVIKTVKNVPLTYQNEIVLCNTSNKIYSVKNELLKEKIGKLYFTDNNPKFEGGIKNLKSYFSENPLTDDKAKDLFFRVSILFVVNYKGEAGNFQIITKGKDELEILANQVLEIVKKMPQNWKPAKKKGKVVDCYQVLSFSVQGGQLDKVSYK